MRGHGPRHLNMARQPKLINSATIKSAPGARPARAPNRRKLGFGWGARIRTWEWRYQKPLPYHLATPHSGKAKRFACVEAAVHTGLRRFAQERSANPFVTDAAMSRLLSHRVVRAIHFRPAIPRRINSYRRLGHSLPALPAGLDLPAGIRPRRSLIILRQRGLGT